MKSLIQYFIFVFLVIGLYGFAFANYSNTGEEPAGKKAFVDAKCNNCHGISSEGIEAKNKNNKNPDLSGIGSTHKADFIKKYLLKTEKLNDKKHPSNWKGEDKALEDIAKWLESLKKK